MDSVSALQSGVDLESGIYNDEVFSPRRSLPSVTSIDLSRFPAPAAGAIDSAGAAAVQRNSTMQLTPNIATFQRPREKQQKTSMRACVTAVLAALTLSHDSRGGAEAFWLTSHC